MAMPGQDELLDVSLKEGVEGDIDALSMWVGQSAGPVSSIEPAADIVAGIVEEARSILRRLSDTTDI